MASEQKLAAVSAAIIELAGSSSPNLSGLEEKLQSLLELSRDDIQQLIYKAVLQLNNRLFPPVTNLELIHTEGCNLACTYCFEKEMLGHRRMPVEIVQAAIDLLFDYSKDSRKVTIVHFGGEPTLNFKAIKTATVYAEQKAKAAGKTLDFEMTSNGTLLNDEMTAFFAEHNVKVLLSVDGMASSNDRYRLDKRGRGTFDSVIRGLNILRKRQSWIGVKMTVMPDNSSRMFEDVMGLRALGVNQFIIGHATGVKWEDCDIENYRAQLQKIWEWYKTNRADDLRIAEFDDPEIEVGFFGCQAGRSSISVSVDGQVSPCSKILGLGTKNVLAKLGDVRYGLTHFLNRSELVSTQKVKSACAKLGISDQYQGGCFASNYSDNGDLYSPSVQDHKFSLLNRTVCGGCASALKT